MDNKRILIIEDEADLVDMLTIRLSNSGFIVFSAFDGEEGLKLFETHRPNLLILDLNLPIINGLEVARRIRIVQNDKTPIIMLSARNEPADKMVGQLRGASRYMTKPFDPHELMDVVKELIHSSESG